MKTLKFYKSLVVIINNFFSIMSKFLFYLASLIITNLFVQPKHKKMIENLENIKNFNEKKNIF